MRTRGYKCSNLKCGSCIGKSLCGEPADTALGCASRLVNALTNADRIRAMSDEELANCLHDFGWDCCRCVEHSRLDNEPLLRGEKCDEKCVQHCLEWLKLPVEDGEADDL